MKFHHNRCLSDQEVHSFILRLEELGYWDADWDFTSDGGIDKFEYVCGEHLVCLYSPLLKRYEIILVAVGEPTEENSFTTKSGNRIPIA